MKVIRDPAPMGEDGAGVVVEVADDRPVDGGEVAARTGTAAFAPPPPLRSAYRADIDGMRTLAVIAVIAFHVDEDAYPSGFVGVDVFFVISGYVVLGSLLRRGPATSARSFFSAFYARRLRRLLPTLLVAVVLTGLGIALVVPPDEAPRGEYFASGAVGVVGFSNYFYYVLRGPRLRGTLAEPTPKACDVPAGGGRAERRTFGGRVGR